MDELINLLKGIEMFAGLSDQQLAKLAAIFEEKVYRSDDVLFSQGDEGDRIYVVCDGFVEIIVETDQAPGGRTLVNLGPGQVVGEMALVDQGTRSATVRVATDATIINSTSRQKFENLCETDTAIGYRIMRNIAADLSFKLRHRNLEER